MGESPFELSSRVGFLAELANVAGRAGLRSRFGDAYGLTISTGANAGTKVTLRLPKYNSA